MFHKIYMSYYEYARTHFSVKSNAVYFDSHSSSDFCNNLYYIARQLLSGKYGDFILYISILDKEELPINIKLLQRDFPDAKICLVIRESIKNYYAISVAKYLFTDVRLSMFYIKRPEQVVVQTWHGTPLKKIGYSYVEDVAFTGGQKKAFIMADYNLFPNVYTMQNMLDAYRLHNNLNGVILLNGYPRNTIFFDTNAAQNLRLQMNLENKRVYVYMPTWRGSLTKSNSVMEQIALLQKIDDRLCEDQVLYVKLHRLVSQKIDFSDFKQIRQFPQDVETYEFLSIADCLITDYSSVMYDFLCTRKKIILYTYDKEVYLKNQGTYMDMNELPFPQVNNIEQLIEEMEKPKQYDDSEAYTKFCSYDNIAAAEQLCDKVILGDNVCKEIIPEQNEKQNILLYGGNLQPNLNTQRFIFYLDHIDSTAENYCVSYRNVDYYKNPIRLQAITDSFDLQAIECYYQGVIGNETIQVRKWRRKLYKDNTLNKKVLKSVKKYFSVTFEQQFCGKHFDKIITFPDTPINVLELFIFADVKEKTFIVDSKMLENPDCHTLIEYAKEQNYTVIQCEENNIDILNNLSC